MSFETGDAAARTEALGRFYSRYPYPWRAHKFDYVEDPGFYVRTLSHELGCYRAPFLSNEAAIWVAGCGINQALTTGLHYPRARVVGSDVSERSLELAQQTAAELGLSNVTLRRESIEDSAGEETYDYIVCTGVIHHSVDPRRLLARIAGALRPSGVAEVMVYNRFHRDVMGAFHEALRLLEASPAAAEVDVDVGERLADARSLVSLVEDDSLLARTAGDFRQHDEAALAHTLVHPRERGYTVRSLAELAAACGLRLVAPSSNLYRQWPAGETGWDLAIAEPGLRTRYERLCDVDRWYVTNLVLFERSPWLRFFLQRDDSPRPVPAARTACDAFLDTVFVRAEATQRNLVLGEDGRYRLSPGTVRLPTGEPYRSVVDVLRQVDGRRTMGEIFERLGRPVDLASVNQARAGLATRRCPYLVPA